MVASAAQIAQVWPWRLPLIKRRLLDLYFAPQKPTDVPSSNWIQTVGGRNFLMAVRLYGTGVEFFD